MRCQLLTLLATLAATVFADVKFTSPASGSSHAGGTTMTITWTDDGTSPSVADLDTYTLNVIFGGTTAATIKSTTLVTGGKYSGTAGSVTVTIPLTAGASSTNGYYLQMVSTSSSETGTDIVYSDRFGMTGMTGTMSAAVSSAIAAAASTDVIADSHGLADAAAGTAVAGAMYYTVAYHLQTGLIKYAPPQPIPPTKITAKGNPTPMNPSTSFTVATTYLSPASITYTLTASQTYTHSSIENTAAAATNTDMRKYLARWLD